MLNILPLRAVLKKLLFSKRRWLRKSAGEPEARALDPELYPWGASFAACCFLAALLGLLDKQSSPRMERNSANSTPEYTDCVLTVLEKQRKGAGLLYGPVDCKWELPERLKCCQSSQDELIHTSLIPNSTTTERREAERATATPVSWGLARRDR